MKIRLASALLLLAACVPLFAGSFEHFPLPRTVALNAYDIAGTDTYAWVLPYSSNLISKVGVDGSVETFVLPGFGIERIVLDPTDNSLWFASPQSVGHMALNGEITQYSLFANAYSVGDLIFGPDDSLWLTLDNQRVLRVTRTGDVTTVLPLDHSFYPAYLTNGPDGNIWISAHDSAKVGRLTPSGTLTQFPLPFSYDSPNGIVAAGDGNLWFTSNFSWLRKITPAGVMTDVSNNLGASGMIGLDGSNRLWWSHTFTNAPAVSVFDVATNTLSATFPLIADGKLIWALSAASNTVWWAGGKKFGRVYQGEMAEFSFNALGANPSAMASSSIDVWFAAPDENQVGRLDPTNGLTTLYTMPNADSRPLDIVAGTDAMWFTEETGNRIGRIDGNGALQEFTIPTPNAKPTAITYGPDGNFWFTLAAADKIGRITPAGVITEFPLPGSGRYPNSLTFGLDGNLWFTSRDNNTIGKMTATGLVTEYPVTGDHPRAIVAAPDGTFVYSTDMHQYRMTPTGDVTLLAQFVAANDAIVGPDGALWSNQMNGVTRIGADGAVKTWTLPHGGWAGNAITIGPDGKVWVSESNTGALYRIIPDAPIAITPVAACRMPDGGVSGVLATFVDPDTTRNASDYNAYVGSAGGQVTQTGPGTFN
ncbi:MAG TPA: hypothetical protein VF787_20345, partial [Thermoanaerobaculia bacterium]